MLLKGELDDQACYVSMIMVWRYYAMKICLSWRVARLESPLHSADIGIVWGANLPLRSRTRECGLLIGL